MGPIVIRADASAAMGTGHVMRCLALAQAWRRAGGSVVFATAELTPAIARRLEHEHFSSKRLNCPAGSSEDIKALASVAAEAHATWVAVDGYQFSSTYQRNIKQSGFKLLWIDDAGRCTPYCADLILNQNLYAASDMYSERGEETHLLLGPEHVLLREEFLGWNNWRREFREAAKRLLVTMGGSDSQNATALILRTLGDAGLNIEIDVVVGGSNPDAETIEQIARQLPCKISLSSDVENMPELMAGADLAISAAGMTCYELALLQVPMILVTLAANQVPTAQSFADRGAAVNLGNFENSKPEQLIKAIRRLTQDSDYRRSLANRARSLVDGNGSSRVCQALLQKSGIESSDTECVRA
jgi:UDP-2,4-diacetamido-2,4,6-trideoxy-beta-L-altropyranose hydrolase